MSQKMKSISKSLKVVRRYLEHLYGLYPLFLCLACDTGFPSLSKMFNKIKIFNGKDISGNNRLTFTVTKERF